MTFTISTRESVSANSLGIDQTRSFTGDLQASLQQTISASTTDEEIALAVDISEVTLVAIKSDQDLTIKTNDSGSPDDTLSISANVPRIWRDGDYNTLFLTADVTSIFVSNGTASDATLQIIVLTDLP